MCLFCDMLEGKVPMDVVRETGESVAFRDINPQAPTHVLVIPRRHVENLG
ncbi:MAG TPA: HIT domain-containing protein, partial [Lapillicoccus sp.]